MAQVNISIKCRICEEPMKLSPNSEAWSFLSSLGDYMLAHDKCEKLAEKFAQAQKAQEELNKEVKEESKALEE